jgi:hypothetical protein
LVYFWEPQKLMLRQVNWTTKLQDFNFTIKHVDGTSNPRANALSQPEGVERKESKTTTLLPDALFVRRLLGKEDLEVEMTQEEKGKTIKQYHNSPMAGHPGVKQTLQLVFRRGLRWKGMRRDVKDYVKGCLVCQKAKLKVGPGGDVLKPLLVLTGT